MRRIIAVFLICLNVHYLNAQSEEIRQAVLDSLRHGLATDSTFTYRFTIYRPFCAIDNRNSFISQAPVNLRGGQLGLRYKEKHVFGFGIYRMTAFSQGVFEFTRPDKQKVSQALRLNYTTLFYKYRIFTTRFVELHLPVELGIGRARARLFDSIRGSVVKTEDIRIFPAGTGLQLVLKPVKWIGISAMGGYRLVNEGSLALNFNGWYYSFGLWLDVRQIYRDTKYYGFQRKRYKREVQRVLAHS